MCLRLGHSPSQKPVFPFLTLYFVGGRTIMSTRGSENDGNTSSLLEHSENHHREHPQDMCRKEAQEDTAGQPVSAALSISVLLPITLCSDADLLPFHVAKHLFPWRSTTIIMFAHKPRVDYQLCIECTHLTRMRTTAILLSDRARSKSNKEPTIEQINKNTSKLRYRYKN